MSDLSKTFRTWQEQDVKRLKKIREKYKRQDNIVWKCFIFGVAIIILFVFFKA